MKIIELFAGIGACSTALKNIGIETEIVDAVEIDKFAIKSFNAIHNTDFEVQDITQWDKYYENIDMITHGSPCTDFSIAGKQEGGDLGSGTRSSLMYESIRIIGKIKPKYILWENVKNVLSKKHKHNFDKYIDTLDILGYKSYYQVLNAKDYGTPQNRERIFVLSIRKDIDKIYEFAQKEELKIKLKDLLEHKVDEKYYLKDYQIEKIVNSTFNAEKKRIQKKEYCDTLLARDWKDPKCVQVGNLKGEKWDKLLDCNKRVYSTEGISPCINTFGGGHRETKIVENKLIQHNFKNIVRVRKYPVNTDKLKDLLITHKINSSKTIGQIADELQVPKTQVEHYFRRDNCFAIPDENIWFRLKEILNIKDDSFDLAITTFEEKEGSFESNNRAYDTSGISPTVTTSDVKIIDLPCIAASRGRNPDNPSDRRVGIETEQRLELNKNGTSNCITSVQKDNYVVEKSKYTENSQKKILNNIIDGDVSNTLTANCMQSFNHDNCAIIKEELRIRKLTPKECWRLMGQNDMDYAKVRHRGMSNSQLYKQARKLNRSRSFRKDI